MRVGHTYVEVGEAGTGRTTLDSSEEDFAETMHYEGFRFETPEEFIAYCDEPWRREVRDALQDLLSPDRSVLSVGSGLGEHELPFHLEGYDIVASDLLPDALERAAGLFPGFRTMRFDVVDPDQSRRYDDVLAAAMESVFDDDQLRRVLENLRSLLEPGGRLIIGLRYHDNLATRVIDRVLLPLVALAGRLKHGPRLQRREHGFRRRRRELVALAESCGFTLGRVRYAGFAMELTRIDLHRRAPRLFERIRRADRRWRVFNNVTVFEFLLETPPRRSR